jgi:hypothetical protein
MKEKILIGGALVILGFAGWRVLSSDVIGAGEEAGDIRVLDIETGHRFYTTMDTDFTGWPVKSSKSGALTGWPAEVCYWNACGEIEGGTWVALQGEESKPCPTCGRPVTMFNRLPPGFKPKRRG